MNATISLPTILRPYADGARKLDAVGSTVGEVFSELAGRHPRLAEQLLSPDGGLPVFVNVFVDDEDIRYMDGLDTGVGERTEITILPAVAGG